MRLRGVMVLLTMVLCSGAAMALPTVMNYQGSLKRGDGTMPQVGTHSIQFRIFDQANGGNELFMQTKVAYVDTNGVFSVTLGEVDDNLRSLSGVFSGDGVGTRYLELTIVTDPSGPIGSPSAIQPRQEMANAPFALRAGYAENMGSTLGNLQIGGDLRCSSNILGMGSQFALVGGGSRLELTNSGDILMIPDRGVSVTNASYFRATLDGGQDALRVETNAISLSVDGVETLFTTGGTTNRISGQTVALQIQGTAQPTAAGQSEVMIKDSTVALNAKDAGGTVRASMTATSGGTNLLTSTALAVSASSVSVSGGSGSVSVSGGSVAVNAGTGAVTVAGGSLAVAAASVNLSSLQSLNVNGSPLMYVQSIRMTGGAGETDNYRDTGVSTNNYTACIVGSEFPSIDLDEYGVGAAWTLRMVATNGTWQVKWNYRIHNIGGGDRWIDVLFIRREFCGIAAPLF